MSFPVYKFVDAVQKILYLLTYEGMFRYFLHCLECEWKNKWFRKDAKFEGWIQKLQPSILSNVWCNTEIWVNKSFPFLAIQRQIFELFLLPRFCRFYPFIRSLYFREFKLIMSPSLLIYLCIVVIPVGFPHSCQYWIYLVLNILAEFCYFCYSINFF